MFTDLESQCLPLIWQEQILMMNHGVTIATEERNRFASSFIFKCAMYCSQWCQSIFFSQCASNQICQRFKNLYIFKLFEDFQLLSFIYELLLMDFYNMKNFVYIFYPWIHCQIFCWCSHINQNYLKMEFSN